MKNVIMGDIKRRTFVKRTAFSAVAISIFGQGIALAGTGSSSGSSKATTEETVDAHVYRLVTTEQRKVQKIGKPEESAWYDESETISLATSPSGDLPPPPVPEAPSGYPVGLGWKESPNDVLDDLDTMPGEGIPQTTYGDSGAGGTQSPTTGDGIPPEGYEWTQQVRTKYTRIKVPYTMTYKFSE
jgi:hypothetical protein